LRFSIESLAIPSSASASWTGSSALTAIPAPDSTTGSIAAHITVTIGSLRRLLSDYTDLVYQASTAAATQTVFIEVWDDAWINPD
jgi:hypothetical protein